MINFLQRLFTQASEQPASTEENELIEQIHLSRNKLEHAWQNFKYAQADYIDIAIMEIHNAENEYTLLNRKLRVLSVNKQEKDFQLLSENPRSQFAWLKPKQNLPLH